MALKPLQLLPGTAASLALPAHFCLPLFITPFNYGNELFSHGYVRSFPGSYSPDRHLHLQPSGAPLGNIKQLSCREKLTTIMATLANPQDETAASTVLSTHGSNGLAGHGISAGKLVSFLHRRPRQARLCRNFNVLTFYTQMRLLYTTARSDYGAFKHKKRYEMLTYSSLP